MSTLPQTLEAGPVPTLRALRPTQLHPRSTLVSATRVRRAQQTSYVGSGTEVGVIWRAIQRMWGKMFLASWGKF